MVYLASFLAHVECWHARSDVQRIDVAALEVELPEARQPAFGLCHEMLAQLERMSPVGGFQAAAPGIDLLLAIVVPPAMTDCFDAIQGCLIAAPGSA